MKCFAGPSGSSVRQLARMTNTDIKSWTEPQVPRSAGVGAGTRSVRMFLVQVRLLSYLSKARAKIP